MTELYRIYQKGDYTAAGVSLREENTGSINISLPPSSTITNAYLYWMVQENEETFSDTGFLNGSPVEGALIATSRDLCWNREVTHYFRADVTNYDLRRSNTVQVEPGGDETLLEGASLVIVYSNPFLPFKTIIINDGGVALPFDWMGTGPWSHQFLTILPLFKG
ncbi:DUF3344 domain-containing protein [Bacillus sp. P14.5]|uniref:DUF3344 domain-containing protein n=1 Tax=Bacillus sp. P14.5 TaxID=1983400 RepID=UPI0031F5CE45